MRAILSRGEPVQLRRTLTSDSVSLRWGARGIKTEHAYINVLLLALALGLAAVMPQITVAQSGLVAYQTQYGSGNVAVVDLSNNTVCAYIPTGAGAVDVQVSPDGSRLYVVNNDNAGVNGTVSVINRTARLVETTVPIGRDPWSLAFSPDGLYAYVTNGRGVSPRVSIIRLSDNTVIGNHPVANYPQEIILTTDGALAYIGHFGGATAVEVWDTSTTMIESSVPVTGREPSHIALTSDGKYLYASDNQTFDWNGSHYLGKVSVIDTDPLSTTYHTEVDFVTTNDIPPFGVGAIQPNHLTFTPDGKELWVSAYGFPWASVIDTDPNSPTYNTEVARVGTSANPITSWNVKFSPDGMYAYFSTNGALVIVDVESRLEVGRIPTIGAGWRTDGLAIATTSGSCGAPVADNEAPTTNADNDPVEVNEGETAADTGTVTDPDGDTVTLSASVGDVVNDGDGTWSWSFPTSDGPTGSQTVTITADDGSATAEATFVLTVNNVAPTVTAVTVPIAPVAISEQPISASGDFTDPAGTADEAYTCTVDYDDGGSPQPGTVAGTTCTGPDQTYAEAGVYTVTVTVTDKDGGAGSLPAETMIVIYDPSGGFVTGGGWINSPEGAYVGTTLIGKASFGFVSKYKKGASVPTGNTEFQFKAGDLNFHSSIYDFLVITMGGTNAQYKGEGTINGSLAPTGANYKFMIWAQDNTPGGDDTFRIKIWYEGGEEMLVYDNGFDQAIGGGNIVVHTGKGGNAKTDELAEIPTEFALHGNYPNPFNPSTSIGFDLPASSNVRLIVFDLLGREVARLVDREMPAGKHAVTWAAGDVPSGMYLYRIEAEDFSQTRQMLLLK